MAVSWKRCARVGRRRARAAHAGSGTARACDESSAGRGPRCAVYHSAARPSSRGVSMGVRRHRASEVEA
eukprot:1242306-Prymnesium_polylepis.1